MDEHGRKDLIEQSHRINRFLADLVALVVFCTLLWLAIEVLT